MVPRGLQTLPVTGGGRGLGRGSGCGQMKLSKGRARTPSHVAHDVDDLPPASAAGDANVCSQQVPPGHSHCAESHLSWCLSGVGRRKDREPFS